jgi:hypothetical protein
MMLMIPKGYLTTKSPLDVHNYQSISAREAMRVAAGNCCSAFRGRLPADFKFDRDEANAR